MTPNDAVAAEVRAEMARQQLSGNRAAKKLGWTQNYISQRLRGVTPFNINDLQAIAELLGVPVTNFFPPDLPRVISQIGQVMTTEVRRPGSCPPLAVAA